jgi:diaminopimelate decarboxylase
VLYAKHGDVKTFSIVDAAMNDLIRPTLYEAHHDIWPIMEAVAQRRALVQDVVGPVCETGDYLAQDRTLPELQSGDLIAAMSAGAYGAAMSSTYNTRPLIQEVLVRGSEWSVIRPRQTYEELIGQDRVPDWLQG